MDQNEMYPDEAIKICESKIQETERLLDQYRYYDGTNFEKELVFYKLVKTALEYFDKC
jgi:hypothetical protein